MDCGRGSITLQRVRELHNLELIRARDVVHALPRHIHETLCIGIVDSGARDSRHRGTRHLIAPGMVHVIPAGESHTCGSLGGGYSYRVLCLSEAAAAGIAAAISPRPAAMRFRGPVIEDVALCRALAAAYDVLAEAGGTMEKETVLFAAFVRLAGYADLAAEPKPGCENRAVRLVKDYLAERYEDNVAISDLATATGLSPYHLIRVFTEAVGLPPHAYLNQVRVNRAKTLLLSGRRLADAALAVGYADQSHFQRWFKKIVGVTPGQFIEKI